MATTERAREYVDTLLYLFTRHCSLWDCHLIHYGPDDLRRAWVRLGELGSEEVFAALTDDQRMFFWICAYATYTESTLFLYPGNPDAIRTRLGYLQLGMRRGEFDEFLSEMQELAP